VKEIFTLNHIGISGKAAKKWQQNGNRLPFFRYKCRFFKKPLPTSKVGSKIA